MKRNISLYIGCLLLILSAFTLNGCKDEDMDFLSRFPKEITLKCDEIYDIMTVSGEEMVVIPADFIEIAFQSEDSSIATVTDDIKVKAGKRPGTTYIKIYNSDKEVVGTIKVNVIPNFTKTISVGETVTLYPIFGLTEYDDALACRYESRDETIVEISRNKNHEYVATGIKPGKTYVVCTYSYLEPVHYVAEITVK